jgi:xylono-1,5-lactonase
VSDIKLLVEVQHRLGEGALWHEARGCLFWIDLYEPSLNSFDPVTGGLTHRALNLATPIGAVVATTRSDRLLISHPGGLSVLDIDNLTLTPYANPENGRPDQSPNDMKVDRWGRLWFGTSHAKELEPRGALWCVEDDKHIHLCDVGFAVSNGPAFSPDGKTMYFSDSANHQILAYDISRDNCLAKNRRVFATFSEDEGMPDGLTVDAEGCVWSAQWAGASVIRLSASGEKLQRISLPSGHVTSVAFHGSTLYITTARDGLSEQVLARYPLSGSVFKLETDAVGVAETLFAL